MAVGNQRKHLFIVMSDKKPDYFVHSISIRHLFQPGPSRGAMEIRILPSPIGQIHKPVTTHERIDLALTDDGSTLVGVGTFKRTVMYDTRSGVTSSGPEMQGRKTGGAYIVPLGDRLYALNRCLTGYDEGNPFGEDLLPASGSWRILPEPPPDFRYLNDFQIKCQLTAYFTTGDHIWVSAQERGCNVPGLETIEG